MARTVTDAHLGTEVLGRMLSLSSAHLPDHERDLLAHLGENTPGLDETDLPRWVCHAYGMVVFVSGHDDPERIAELTARMHELHLDSLAAIYALALAADAVLVDLDRDGPPCDALVLYDAGAGA